MKTARLLPLTLVLCLFGTLASAFCADTASRSFKVAQGGTFTLDSDYGAVSVTGAGGDQVRIKVEGDKDLEDILSLNFTQEGNNIIVTAKGKSERSFFGIFNFGFNHKVLYTVEVPASFNTDIHTGGGSIELSGVSGQQILKTSGGHISVDSVSGSLDAHTSGGPMDLNNIKGPVNARTSGGSVSAEGIEGNCSLYTSGGPIKVNGCTGALDAETSGGSVRIERLSGSVNARSSGGGVSAEFISQPAGDCELRTSGGTVSITLPGSVSAHISAHTSGGRVSTDIPVLVREINDGTLDGNMGSGGPQIVLRTSGGSIHIKAAQ
jgi:hypothetical protein